MKTAEGTMPPKISVSYDDDGNVVIEDRLLNRTIVLSEEQAKQLETALGFLFLDRAVGNGDYVPGME